MGENDDSDIIEHHVEEEMEKKGVRSYAASSSFLESVSPSEREGHSSTQSSHRLLAYSDALISIIATVMVGNTPSFATQSQHLGDTVFATEEAKPNSKKSHGIENSQ